MSRQKGSLGEQQACDYLTSQGLKLVMQNYSCRMGEIDLIMQEANCLVFVEVRQRASSAFGGALASVTYSKQQKLLKTAMLYLLANRRDREQAIRFDVLGLEGVPAVITWVKNAFGTDF